VCINFVSKDVLSTFICGNIIKGVLMRNVMADTPCAREEMLTIFDFFKKNDQLTGGPVFSE